MIRDQKLEFKTSNLISHGYQNDEFYNQSGGILLTKTAGPPLRW